jgi:hypothetical protein
MRVANQHGIILSFMALSVLVLSACSRPTAWRDESVGQGTRSDDVRWPFWPTSMRLHPLSRVVIDPDGSDHVEAHIEFRDKDGHTTRATGSIRIDLFDLGQTGDSASWLEWNVDLADLESNRLHYDDVMRTYSFRLNLADQPLPDRPALIARFVSEDGLLFENRLTLRPPTDRRSPDPAAVPSPDPSADAAPPATTDAVPPR